MATMIALALPTAVPLACAHAAMLEMSRLDLAAMRAAADAAG